jgi:hypothetical protein
LILDIARERGYLRRRHQWSSQKTANEEVAVNTPRKPARRSAQTGDNFSGVKIEGSGNVLGRHARSDYRVVNQNLSGLTDPKALRAALEELYTELENATLTPAVRREAQVATVRAVASVDKDDPDKDEVISNIQKIGKALEQADATVQKGSGMLESIRKLSPLLAPLGVGASLIGTWFGVTIPQ